MFLPSHHHFCLFGCPTLHCLCHHATLCFAVVSTILYSEAHQALTRSHEVSGRRPCMANSCLMKEQAGCVSSAKGARRQQSVEAGRSSRAFVWRVCGVEGLCALQLPAATSQPVWNPQLFDSFPNEFAFWKLAGSHKEVLTILAEQ